MSATETHRSVRDAAVLPEYQGPVSAGHICAVDLYGDLGSWFYDQLDTGSSGDTRSFLRALQRNGCRSVVDIAAGSGRIAVALASRGFKVTAVDNSEAMLNRLRERLLGLPDLSAAVHLVHCDASALRVLEPVDAIVIGATSICLFDPQGERPRLFAAARAALRPGGLLIFDVGRPPARLVSAGRLSRLVTVQTDGGEVASVFTRTLDGPLVERLNVLLPHHPHAERPVLLTARKNVVDPNAVLAELEAAEFELENQEVTLPLGDEHDSALTLTCRAR